jgi:hypothetical protein
MNIRAARRPLATLLLLTPMVGCQPGSVTVTGKVIEGNISFAGVVDPTDERLKGGGLSDVTVSGRKVVDGQPGLGIGEAKSDHSGNFKIEVREQSAFMQQAQFTAHKDGYINAVNTMPLPSVDRRLLVILKPDTAAPRAK